MHNIEQTRNWLLNHNMTALTSVCSTNGELKYFIYTMPIKYLNLPSGFTVKKDSNLLYISNGDVKFPLKLRYKNRNF